MALVLLAGLVGGAQPAQAGATCTTDLLNCYVAAAKIDNFWYRTAAGIDCEIDYAGCVNQALAGF
jgi:hypothetical protein